MKGDTSPYNTPDEVRANIASAISRMEKADHVLGVRRLGKFSKAVSRILYHIEPSLEGLNSYRETDDYGAQRTTLIISAATELETAWNLIRLANMPSAQRNGRVASELIAIVVLSCVPRNELEKLPKKQAPISNALRQHPNKSVFDIFEPIPIDPADQRKSKPILLSTDFFKSFLHTAEVILEVPSGTLHSFKDYRIYVQHPASHGSSEVVQHYFEGLNARTKKAGAYLPKRRYRSLRFEADQLIALVEFLADILDWTAYQYLRKIEAA